MRKRHDRRPRRFTMVDRAADRLPSLAAQGLVAYLEGLHEDAHVTREIIQSQRREGETLVRRAFQELMDAGMLVYFRVQYVHRDGDSRPNTWRTHFIVSSTPYTEQDIRQEIDWIERTWPVKAIRVEPARLDPRTPPPVSDPEKTGGRVESPECPSFRPPVFGGSVSGGSYREGDSESLDEEAPSLSPSSRGSLEVRPARPVQGKEEKRGKRTKARRARAMPRVPLDEDEIEYGEIAALTRDITRDALGPKGSKPSRKASRASGSPQEPSAAPEPRRSAPESSQAPSSPSVDEGLLAAIRRANEAADQGRAEARRQQNLARVARHQAAAGGLVCGCGLDGDGRIRRGGDRAAMGWADWERMGQPVVRSAILHAEPLPEAEEGAAGADARRVESERSLLDHQAAWGYADGGCGCRIAEDGAVSRSERCAELTWTAWLEGDRELVTA